MEWIIAWGHRLALGGAVAAALAAGVAALGAWGTTQQQNRDQLHHAERIAGLYKTIAELQATVAEKSAESAAKSDRIAELTGRNLAATTGGDSFCTLHLSDLDRAGGPQVILKHRGDSPLSGLTISIADSERDLNEGRSMKTRIGDLAEGTEAGIASDNVRRRFLVSGEAKDFFVGFRARNGFWRQEISLRRVDGVWKTAIRVFRRKGSVERQLLAEVDKGFPQ
jgi:hypothetical protein